MRTFKTWMYWRSLEVKVSHLEVTFNVDVLFLQPQFHQNCLDASYNTSPVKSNKMWPLAVPVLTSTEVCTFNPSPCLLWILKMFLTFTHAQFYPLYRLLDTYSTSNFPTRVRIQEWNCLKNTSLNHPTGKQVYCSVLEWGSALCQTHDRIKDLTTWHLEHSLFSVNTVNLQMITFCFYLYGIQLFWENWGFTIFHLYAQYLNASPAAAAWKRLY